MKSSEEITWSNPLLSTQTKLEIALGGLDYRDEVITNLRSQISNLRDMLLDEGHFIKNIEQHQYKHLKKEL